MMLKGNILLRGRGFAKWRRDACTAGMPNETVGAAIGHAHPYIKRLLFLDRWPQGLEVAASPALLWSPAITTDSFAGSIALRKAAFSCGSVTAISFDSNWRDHS